jgi:hypothetical protein
MKWLRGQILVLFGTLEQSREVIRIRLNCSPVGTVTLRVLAVK